MKNATKKQFIEGLKTGLVPTNLKEKIENFSSFKEDVFLELHERESRKSALGL